MSKGGNRKWEVKELNSNTGNISLTASGDISQSTVPLLRILHSFNHGTTEIFSEVNNILTRFTIQKSQNCWILAVPQNGFYSFCLLFHLQWLQPPLGDWVFRAQDKEFCILCTKQSPTSCSLSAHRCPTIFRATFFCLLAINCQTFKQYLIWSTHFIGMQSGARKSYEIYVFKVIQLI